MHTLFRTCALSGLLGLLGLAVQAQPLGHYNGTTSQGSPVSFDVVDDGSGGVIVAGFSMSWTASCTRSGPGRGVGWGVWANSPVVDNKTAFELAYNMVYEKVRMSFRQQGEVVSGSFLGRTPEFVDVTSSTRLVEMCDSGALTFEARRDASSAPAAAAAGSASTAPWPLTR